MMEYAGARGLICSVRGNSWANYEMKPTNVDKDAKKYGELAQKMMHYWDAPSMSRR